MLDHFTILTQGGLVLFERAFVALRGAPVDELVAAVLLEERGAALRVFGCGEYALRWRVDNKHGLIFVAVYQKALSLTYVDVLLRNVKVLLRKRVMQ